MESFFKLKERSTTDKTELIAGMTTFFAMVYILMVNANMFADPFGDGSNPPGVSYGIAFGLISYIVISVFCGDFKKIKGSSWVITALFVAMLVLTH